MKRTLFDEIQEAVTRQELSLPTKGALDHIRQFGNWGAHPVEDQAKTIIEVSRDEADYTLQVLELLFSDLYVVPRRTAEMKEKIAKKK